ncbi:CHAT domain-containing protein [Pantanalinema sp. GBBB05]|uniref:CHAT domain-containing protein n=1 Tax=Pantanalinema sp. GBBB05 TaxID=2604139 RepID=UPI001DD3DCE4|nr:CHAT domain-containing protein [Pantanalinema sp. GBBB05]
MAKLVVLKFVNGNFEQGFSVVLQISEEGDRPFFQTIGHLPAAPQLPQLYKNWQTIYHGFDDRTRKHTTASPHRLEIPAGQVTNVSMRDECDNVAHTLAEQLNQWLRSETFRPIREGILENLKRNDRVRLILQTEDPLLKRLPWHIWDICDRYPRTEMALSAATYGSVRRQPHHPTVSGAKVRILAILGSDHGIDVQADQRLLRRLPNAEITFLVKPKRKELNDQLWAQGWDILFFAGHSASQPNDEAGKIYINDTESLTTVKLRYALKKAVESGLKLAIFNSCDGLGLARDLADLQIPQVIVMREPVPDLVAQEFLKSFLEAFARGESFYLAVREAREKLQGLEDQFPCATWLPIICQNPAEIPPTWANWCGQSASEQPKATSGKERSGHRVAPHLDADSSQGIVIRITADRPAATQTLPRPVATAKRRPKSKSQKFLERSSDITQQLYQFGNRWLQLGLLILQATVIGGVSSCVGAAIGFWLAYRSPMTSWWQIWLPKLSGLLPFGLQLRPAIVLFAVTGFCTACGLMHTRHLERQPWFWTSTLLAAFGYALAWASWQFGMIQTTWAGMIVLGAIAALFLIAGLGLVEHPLLHVIIAVVGTGLVSWVGLLSAKPVILLLSVQGNTVLSADAFSTALYFFSRLGTVISLWFAISYFVIAPRMLRSRWQ